MRKFVFIILMFVLHYNDILGQEISVSLFQSRDLHALVVTIQKGQYIVYNGGEIVDTLEVGNNISVVFEGNHIVYRHRRNAFATDKEITLRNQSDDGSFFINYSGSAELARCYDGWIKFKPLPDRILAINYVPLDSYVAAVVEAITVSRAPEEFYMAMAILARTYAIYQIERHSEEGFSLCDGTHCQIYNFKSSNRLIVSAANRTSNMVLVDRSFQPIDPAYHLNSGGQTINYGFAWLDDKQYYKSTIDNFAKFGVNFHWQHSMSQIRWKEFLINNGLKHAARMPIKELLVDQPERKKYFKVANDSIKMSDISSKLGLNSSFFSMSIDRTNVVFSGKGRGHGVGLSVESAIEMAGTGYDYERILNFFYNDIRIVNINMLPVFNVMKQNVRRDLP